MQVDQLKDLCWLEQVQPGDRSEVGDKASNLALVIQRGYPVIPGFVVPHRVFRRFLSEINWLEPLFGDLPDSALYVDVNNARQLQAIAQQIRQAIVTTPLWDDWLAQVETQVQAWEAPMLILRPSLALMPDLEPALTNSTRGLLSAQVCRAERGAIAHGLRQVWAELFRAKSLFYWQRSRLQLHQLRLGVLVQPIQSAIAAGDAHIDSSRLEIRSVCGLGMALNWGDITPDIAQLHPSTGALQTHTTGLKTHAYRLAAAAEIAEAKRADPDQPGYASALCLKADLLDSSAQHHSALTADQRQQVADLVRHVHASLGHDLDVEWTIPSLSSDAATALTAAPCITQVNLTQINLTQINVQRRLVPSTDDSIAAKPECAASVSTRAAALIATEEQSAADAAAVAAHLLSGTPSMASSIASQRSSNLGSIDQSTAPDLVLTGIAAAPGETFARVLVIADGHPPLALIPVGTVLVVPSVTPNWLPQLQQVSGIIAEQGGMTSHGAILARELGIPAVVGVPQATQLLQTGDLVGIYGDRGSVYRLAPHTTLLDLEQQTNDAPPLQTWGRPNATQLMLNVSQVEAIARSSQLPVDGIGLLRAEHLLLGGLPSQSGANPAAQPPWTADPAALTQQLVTLLQPFVVAFAPRPVFYRSLDVRSHEFSSLSSTPLLSPGANPILGCHGTFSYRLHPAYFEAELAALRQIQQAQLQQAGYSNLRLILPFVRTVEEFQFCQQRVVEAGLTQAPNFELWIMAEVPAVLFLLPEFVQAGVQGIAIGSNDLTQLLLAIDRDNPQMADAYTAAHPAVMRAMQQLIETARQLGIPCCICGEAPVLHPEIIDDLVRWGISSISVNPAAIPQTYRAIARAEQRLLLDAARRSLEP